MTVQEKAEIAATVLEECYTPFLQSFAPFIRTRFQNTCPDAHEMLNEYLTHVWYFVREHGGKAGSDLRADYVLLCLIHDQYSELRSHLKRSNASIK